ncbi:ras-like protein 1 [Histomonas meleagridis]|uniref:ras-like protein 1 n=1 Tax=Histomonas meleagridis TaxID=135588 RepID=UPI003559E8EE|nr:ras-like protein 1 [Histomonas meleagridis]KAH0798710.1 ras-like protein 1 [Histomonas meleagridis]
MEVNYLRPQFVRSYDCFVLVYSVNDHYSFELINDIYNTICRYKDSDHFPCVICANKIDLENERIIKSEEGKALAEQLGVRYVEASAKTGQGVIELFETAVKEYLKYNGIEDEPKVPKLAKRKEVCNVQ